MKICVLCDLFPPYLGGAELSAFELSKELSKRGHIIHVLTKRLPGTPNYQKMDGIHVHRFEFLKPPRIPFLTFLKDEINYAYAALKTASFVRKAKIDLIYTQGPFSPSGVIASKLSGRPVVMMVRDYWPICIKRNCLTPEGKVCLECNFQGIYRCTTSIWDGRSLARLHRLLRASYWLIHLHSLRKLLSKSDAILALSGYVKGMLERYSIPSGKINVAPTALDVNEFDKNMTKRWKSIEEIEELKRKNRIVLYVGALRPSKGADYLVRAVPYVTKKVENVTFVIAGDGPLKSYLKELALKLGIERTVLITGRISYHILPRLYSLSDVVVFPSIWPEPFGRISLEAMAARKPIVASNRGGITDIVRNGENGLIVEPIYPNQIAEAVIKLLSDKALAKSMGERGRTILEEKYTWDKVVRIYEAVFSNLKYR